MQKELRESYREIANLGAMGLCNFCKYANWTGGCIDPDLECEHPLPIINGEEGSGDQPYDTWQGSDCWGFRPRYRLQECATIASISHDGNVPHWSKKGEWVAIIPTTRDKEVYDL